MTASLKTEIAGIELKNPFILASGIMGVSASALKLVEDNGAGAVTMKSIGPVERPGHANPTVFSWEHGIANAVGLSNPGIDLALEKIHESHERLTIPLIVSFFADKLENFQMIAEKILPLKPALVELNLSCPNTDREFGRMFALSTQDTEAVIKVVKQVLGPIKVFAKLTPDTFDIAEIGKAAEAAGADGITAINTVSGMIIDAKAKRPVLTNRVGGICGPAIKPMAIRAVYNLSRTVKIPIIGTGGIMNGNDAAEMIMAGASAIGIGAGVYYRGLEIFKLIQEELTQFMQQNGFASIEEMKGKAHVD